MHRADLTNSLPSVSDLESMAFESLQAIENPEERLKQFHKLIRERIWARGDHPDDFRDFFISPKGVIASFIRLLDSTPTSDYRDKTIVSIIDLTLDHGIMSWCDDEGFERARTLFYRIETDEWKDEAEALFIKFLNEHEWYDPAGMASSSQEIELLVQNVKREYQALKNPMLHCRLLTKLVRIMAEDENINYAVELAYRIEDTYRKFAALVSLAFEYLKSDIYRKNKSQTLLVSLLKNAEKLLPEIPDECRKYGDYKKYLEDITTLYCEAGCFDEMITALDRIPELKNRLFNFRSAIEKMHRMGQTQGILRVVQYYYSQTQFMPLVEKAKWISSIVNIRKCYGNFIDTRELVFELYEEICQENRIAVQIMAMLPLAECYIMLDDNTQACEIYNQGFAMAEDSIDPDIHMQCQVEILAAMGKNVFGHNIINIFEKTEDHCLLALAYLRCHHELNQLYSHQENTNGAHVATKFRSMINRIIRAVSALKNPVERARGYCHLAETKQFYDSIANRPLWK